MQRIIWIAFLFFGACQASKPPEATAPRPELEVASIPEKKEVPVLDPKSPAIAEDKGMTRLVEMAKRDLAATRKLDPEAIEVVEARYVSWPDASAGCPKPGMMYPQVVTNGTLIRLRENGKEYAYHSSQDRAPFYCANPSGSPIDDRFGDK